jgi:hypothetical protein
MGAPTKDDDAKTIIEYLSARYGNGKQINGAGLARYVLIIIR